MNNSSALIEVVNAFAKAHDISVSGEVTYTTTLNYSFQIGGEIQSPYLDQYVKHIIEDDLVFTICLDLIRKPVTAILIQPDCITITKDPWTHNSDGRFHAQVNIGTDPKWALFYLKRTSTEGEITREDFLASCNAIQAKIDEIRQNLQETKTLD